MFALEDAFDMLQVWLSEIKEDEKAQEEFYNYSFGYSFDDISQLLTTTEEFYKTQIQGK